MRSIIISRPGRALKLRDASLLRRVHKFLSIGRGRWLLLILESSLRGFWISQGLVTTSAARLHECWSFSNRLRLANGLSNLSWLFGVEFTSVIKVIRTRTFVLRSIALNPFLRWFLYRNYRSSSASSFAISSNSRSRLFWVRSLPVFGSSSSTISASFF